MNRLARSTSPYLLQHANNPVEWQPWGDQAINQARLEDKPIFLSVGYAACHWCHVMAHESFENEEVASFLNRHFINIKVDREERPDIDGIYMQAVVAMTGSGGWPMSVFLGHDLAPFYGGTYFPPSRKFNLPSFMDVLLGISNAWKNEREELLKVGEKIRIHLTQTTSSSTSGSIAPQQFNSIAANLRSTYDWGYGGWGDAPKFPQPMVTEFLLQHSLLESGEELQRLIGHYLQALARGGMYDVVGGGFSRYSTDRFWRIPHFEKMLYDNALLARQYLHAWQVLREPLFRRVAEETIEFVTREMTNNAGGFYSSLDADSEGQEGKFYAWTLEEIRSALGSDSELFESAYGISALGNWEGKTILQRALDDASLASRFKLDLETVSANIGSSHALLLAARNLRIRPSTDEKIITAWNGLMLATFSEAARILNNQGYLKVATRNAEFLLSELRPEGSLRRSWREGRATSEVYLEDYAALILGLLELYQTDFNNSWFTAACELTDEMIEKFNDPQSGFFDTPHDQELLLFRPKDFQDNATPSGNSLACEALLKLAAFTGREHYRDLAEKAGTSASSLAVRYPLGFGRWLSALEFASQPVKQVAILGDRSGESFQSFIRIARDSYRPHAVVAASTYPPSDSGPMLLYDRPLINGGSTAYVCESFVCKQPTSDLDVFQKQLNTQE